MKHILTTILLLSISKAAFADIIKYEYSLNYTGYEYYGVSYLDELQIASELDDLNTNPIEVSFTYDDTLMYYSYWLDGENRVSSAWCTLPSMPRYLPSTSWYRNGATNVR